MERFPGRTLKSKLAKCQRLSIVWTLPIGKEGISFLKNFYSVVQISDIQQGKSATINKHPLPPYFLSPPHPIPPGHSLKVYLLILKKEIG